MGQVSADQQIKEMLADNDPRALDLIWETYALELRAYLISIVCSVHDAEDVLQDVFITIARKRDKVARAKHLKSYLYSMSRNTAVNRIKKSKRREARENKTVEWLETVEEEQERGDETIQLENALAGLPDKQRTVMIMKFFQNLTFKEIAERLGISENTAGSRYRYAMDKLKAVMKESPSG